MKKENMSITDALSRLSREEDIDEKLITESKDDVILIGTMSANWLPHESTEGIDEDIAYLYELADGTFEGQSEFNTIKETSFKNLIDAFERDWSNYNEEHYKDVKFNINYSNEEMRKKYGPQLKDKFLAEGSDK